MGYVTGRTIKELREKRKIMQKELSVLGRIFGSPVDSMVYCRKQAGRGEGSG